MLIVDMSMLVRRAYSKMDFLRSSTGVPTGLEYGTMRSLEMLKKVYPDQEIVLCYDSRHNYKRDADPNYKAGRMSPGPQFYKRFNEFKKFLGCVYTSVEKEGYEADDLMFTIAVTTPGPHLLYTNDKDLLQAVSKDVTQLKSFHSKLFIWDEDKVKEEYGVTPSLLPMFMAFVGDAVDNIIGVPRINKKFLAALIMWGASEGMTIDEILQEIASAAWSLNMRALIQEFIDSGQWHNNYDLIKLKATSYQIRHIVTDDVFVIAMLKHWEIYTLGLSKKYGLVGSEEF